MVAGFLFLCCLFFGGGGVPRGGGGGEGAYIMSRYSVAISEWGGLERVGWVARVFGEVVFVRIRMMEIPLLMKIWISGGTDGRE